MKGPFDVRKIDGYGCGIYDSRNDHLIMCDVLPYYAADCLNFAFAAGAAASDGKILTMNEHLAAIEAERNLERTTK